MRRFFGVLSFVALLSSSPGFGKCPQSENATRERLLQIADAFDQAQLTKNRSALDRMVADDLIFIEATGKRSDKKAFVDGWTAPGDRYDPIVLIDRIVIPLGRDAFMVSAQTTLTGSSDGSNFSSAFRFTDTFRCFEGHWRAVHIQVTRIRSQD